MGSTAIQRVGDLVEGALEDVDDPEVRFRLRTALQLVEILDERHAAAAEALAECDLDDGTRERLRRLGYLD